MPKTLRTSKKRGKKPRKKNRPKKKTKTKKIRSPPRKREEIKIDRALTDNFITLQKIMVNFSTKFDILSNQISKLLELFEISAKSLAKKDLEIGKEGKDMQKVFEKLDNISQQAGLIGKGLALIHETRSERMPPMLSPSPPIPPRKPVLLPKRPAPGMQGYQRSIASGNSESPPSKSLTKEIPR